MPKAKHGKTLVVIATALTAGQQVNAVDANDFLLFSKEPVLFKPQLNISETYNDNLFYNTGTRVSDFITGVSPGFTLQIGQEDRNFIALNYLFSQYFYVDNSQLNTSEHAIGIRNKVEGLKLVLSGSDSIQFLSSPLGGIESVNVRENVDRVSFFDDYTLSYNYSEKTSVYVSIRHAATDYQEGVTILDIRSLTGTLGFGYQALPKTVFFGEVYYGVTTTESNSIFLQASPDMSFVGGYLGARGYFTERLSGTVRVGFESRFFDDDSQSLNEPVVGLSVGYRMTEKSILNLSYSRQNNVSVQTTGLAYTADLIRLDWNQTLGASGKWSALLGTGYNMYHYSGTGAREDDVLMANFVLAYQIQLWLTTSLGYSFEKYNSDRAGVTDYDVNRVSLRLAIGY